MKLLIENKQQFGWILSAIPDLFTPPPELCSEDADLYDLKFENQGDFRIVIGDQSVQNYDRNARILLGSPDNLTILVAATENVLYIVRQLQNSSSVPDGSTYTFVHLQFSGVHVQNSRIELIDSKGESVYSTEVCVIAYHFMHACLYLCVYSTVLYCIYTFI